MSLAAVIIIANNCLSVNLKNQISQIYRNSRNTENTLKGLAQAKIIKKSVILFRVLNMTI